MQPKKKTLQVKVAQVMGTVFSGDAAITGGSEAQDKRAIVNALGMQLTLEETADHYCKSGTLDALFAKRGLSRMNSFFLFSCPLASASPINSAFDDDQTTPVNISVQRLPH